MKHSVLLAVTVSLGTMATACSSAGTGGANNGPGTGGGGGSRSGGQAGSASSTGGSSGSGGQTSSSTGGTSGNNGGSPGSGGAPSGTGGAAGGTGGSSGADAGDAARPETNPGGEAGTPSEPATPGPTDLTKHRYSKAIKLDTTAAGAGVMGDVLKYPVAVLLNAMNFDFAQAMPAGEDIRFATPEGTLLPYSIELWDVATKQAAIWVKVDVKGNSNTQSIVMHWGNPAAQSASSSRQVFSMEDGYRGVFHLDQDGSNAPGHYKDSSPHEAHLTGFRMEPGTAVAARIGKGTELSNPGGQGKNQWLGIEGPKVVTEYNAGPNKAVTATAWAYAHTFGGYYETIFSKGDHAWTLQRDYMGRMEACTWSGSYHACAITGAPVTKRWNHYMVVSTTSQLTLFIDGRRVAGTASFNQTSDHGFAIAHNYEAHADALAKRREWHGIIDEVRVIVGPAKDANWALLDFGSQKEGSTFLTFGPTMMK
ncbi:MAG TPA: DUF2341 domain-containing protein [Polyangia bacterium]